MSFASPGLLVALVAVPLALLAYRLLSRPAPPLRRALPGRAHAGRDRARGPGWRRHLPPALFLLALRRADRGAGRPADHGRGAGGAGVGGARDRRVALDARRRRGAQPPGRRARGRRALPRPGARRAAGRLGHLRRPAPDRGEPELRPRSGEGRRSTGWSRTAAPPPATRSRPRSTCSTSEEGRRPPAAIVLLSDGESTLGRDPIDVAREAGRQRVPIYTVALGTSRRSSRAPSGELIPVPPDPEAMRRIAEVSGGEAFRAQDDDRARLGLRAARLAARHQGREARGHRRLRGGRRGAAAAGRGAVAALGGPPAVGGLGDSPRASRADRGARGIEIGLEGVVAGDRHRPPASFRGGGIPNWSRSPWTISMGTVTASSSGSRLSGGLPLARRGGSSGKARHSTPAAPVACAVRQRRPRSGRAAAGDQRERLLSLPRRPGARHRGPGRVELAGRRGRTPSGHAVGLLHQGHAAAPRERAARAAASRSGARHPPPAPCPRITSRRAHPPTGSRCTLASPWGVFTAKGVHGRTRAIWRRSRVTITSRSSRCHQSRFAGGTPVISSSSRASAQPVLDLTQARGWGLAAARVERRHDPAGHVVTGVTLSAPSSPTDTWRRPSISSRSSSPTSSRRQPRERAHARAVLAAPHRRHQRGQLRLGGDQLGGHAALERAVAHHRLGQRDQRRLGRVAPRRLRGRGRGLLGSPCLICSISSAPRRCSVCWGSPRMFSSAGAVLRAPPGQLHQGLVGDHVRGRAVHLSGDVLAPLAQPPRHRAALVVQAAQPGQPLVRALGRAHVVGLLHHPALLARPLQPPLLGQLALDRRAQREQAARVVGGVGELLLGQRALVPAGEPLAALQLHAEHPLHQRLVALLVAEAEEARGHLRVEDVASCPCPRCGA